MNGDTNARILLHTYLFSVSAPAALFFPLVSTSPDTVVVLYPTDRAESTLLSSLDYSTLLLLVVPGKEVGICGPNLHTRGRRVAYSVRQTWYFEVQWYSRH